MRFFLSCFTGRLLTRLRRWGTWLLVVLLPASMLAAVMLIPAEEAAAPVQVGVVIPADDPEGEEYLRRLSLRNGTVVTFLPAQEEVARRNVAAGRWDCALLLPDDFTLRVEQLDTRRLITVLTGPASVVWPLVQETAAACLAEQISPRIAEEYLLESGIVTQEQLPALSGRLESVLPEQQRVLIGLERLGEETVTADASGMWGIRSVLSGVIAIMLLVWVMFSAMDLGRWLETPFAQRLCGMKPVMVLLLPRMAADLLLVLISGAAAMLCLGQPVRYLVALVPYLMLLGVFSLLSARWKAIWTSFPILLPFVPPLCLVLSPVLFDPTALFPGLAPISAVMPVTLYLHAADGSAAAALGMTGAAVLLLLLLVLPFNGRRTERISL